MTLEKLQRLYRLSKTKPSNSSTCQNHTHVYGSIFHSIENWHAKQQISQQCPMPHRTRVHKQTHTFIFIRMWWEQIKCKKIFLFLFIESRKQYGCVVSYTLRIDPLFHVVRDQHFYMHYCVCSKQFSPIQFNSIPLFFVWRSVELRHLLILEWIFANDVNRLQFLICKLWL